MTSPGSFDERMQFLSEQVGTGNITAGCTVDQPYAQNQHENHTFSHKVGRANYLGGPLLENASSYVDGLARAAITSDGSRIRGEMEDIAEGMAKAVLSNAPRDPDVGDMLANSANPWVEDKGIRIFDRPAKAPRSYDHR